MENQTTLQDVIFKFQKYNEAHNIHYGSISDVPIISAVIVYKESNFIYCYSEKERSYRITNKSGKSFFNGMIGNSIYGDCLDGQDVGVRLDAYDWDIERVYFEEEYTEE